MADYLSYLKNNPDVAKWVTASGLGDQAGAERHFLEWGAGEGRDWGDSPEANYLERNPDVAKWAFGAGQGINEAASGHYSRHGEAEGRAWDAAPVAPAPVAPAPVAPAPVAAGSLSPSFSAYMNRDPELARQTQADTSMSDMDYILQHWNTFGQGEGRVSPYAGGGGSVFDLPTLKPGSAKTTSGIDWGSPGVGGLLDRIKDWTGRASGLAENATSNIGNFYNNLMRESLGPQAFQGTLNNLRERNMLDSSVASDAMANAQTGIASNIGNRAFDTYLKGYDTQMQMPGMLSQMAKTLGGTSNTDPMAAYRLVFGNYV